MTENKDSDNAKDTRPDLDHVCFFINRQERDRRNVPSASYTYISAVGWIDRRERCRRKNDTYGFRAE